MKKFLLSCLIAFGGFHSFAAEPIPADDILKFVRTKLPDTPLKLTGSLKAKAERNNFIKSYPVQMDLNWGATQPTAVYQIDKESLTITWNNDIPAYAFSNPKNSPTSEIMGTGITWADLSFSVLWWPNSKLVDEGTKLNRDCFIVEVPVPDSDKKMRLWIEKKMGMLMEAHTLNSRDDKLRRLKIKSIKKMDGMWVAKDLELTNYETNRKTTLQISDLEWKEPEEKAEPLAVYDPTDSINKLAFDLYERLSSEQDGNLFFSPYSISSALAMTYGGARGDTETEMENTLHFGGQGPTHPEFSRLRKSLNELEEKGAVKLSVANSLWPHSKYPFLPDYLAMTKEFYGAEIKAVDYASDAENARLKINGWVELKTQNRIKDLIPKGGLDAMTRLVLANAIYFKGNWAEQFNKEATRPGSFKLAGGTNAQRPMMSNTADFNLAHNDDFKALELPYAENDLSMVILLPNKTGPFPPITAETVSHLQFSKTKVMVQLPKFKIQSGFSLADTLTAMGMPLAFNPDLADFSGMDGKKNLYIGSVFHKAFVEVNEEGTEAAAATGITIGVTSMPPQFICDRPFLFIIRENATGTILFMGRVMDPAT